MRKERAEPPDISNYDAKDAKMLEVGSHGALMGSRKPNPKPDVSKMDLKEPSPIVQAKPLEEIRAPGNIELMQTAGVR